MLCDQAWNRLAGFDEQRDMDDRDHRFEVTVHACIRRHTARRGADAILAAVSLEDQEGSIHEVVTHMALQDAPSFRFLIALTYGAVEATLLRVVSR